MADHPALLPCPFCGGQAELLRDEDTCAPTCSECDFVLEIGPFGIGWYGSESDAAAAWNRRAPVRIEAAAPAVDPEKYPSTRPADQLPNDVLIEVALASAGRAVMYRNEVQLNRREECRRELHRRLAALPEGALPAAWRSKMPGDTKWVVTEHEPTVPDIVKQPLYTTPPQPHDAAGGNGESAHG